MSRRRNQRAHPCIPSRRSSRLISRGETSPTNLEDLEQPDLQEQPSSDAGEIESVASLSSEAIEDIGDQEPENANLN